MSEVGAPTDTIRRFISLLRDEGMPLTNALAAAGAPESARIFVDHTMRVVQQGTTLEALAAFLFGREDLIPEMFARLLPRWTESREARGFAYYVRRHIELDGDEHGPAGVRALVELAGDDDAAWRSATDAAEEAMVARIALWDAIRDELRHTN
jgi:hypothetical protein